MGSQVLKWGATLWVAFVAASIHAQSLGEPPSEDIGGPLFRSYQLSLAPAAEDESEGGGSGEEPKGKGGLSSEELAKLAQNPIANLISIPFQNNFYFGVGPNYNLPKGWYLTSSPVITADWNAPHRDMWTFPVGAGFGKIVKLGGKLPINLQIAAYDNVVTPRNGPDWQLRAQLTVLLPKAIFESK
jgi:hypothetical protein